MQFLKNLRDVSGKALAQQKVSQIHARSYPQCVKFEKNMSLLVQRVTMIMIG